MCNVQKQFFGKEGDEGQVRWKEGRGSAVGRHLCWWIKGGTYVPPPQ